jgi:hypothetical protein
MHKITTDFYLACWLFLHKNVELVEHTREQNHSIFIFQGAGIEDLVQEYESKNARINLHELIGSMRKMKHIMYNKPTIDNGQNKSVKE